MFPFFLCDNFNFTFPAIYNEFKSVQYMKKSLVFYPAILVFLNGYFQPIKFKRNLEIIIAPSLQE